MSASFTEGRKAPVIPLQPLEQLEREFLAPERQAGAAGGGGLADQLTTLAQAMRKLEQALAQERLNGRKLQAGWAKSQDQLMSKLKEQESRVRELQFVEHRMKGKLVENERVEADLRVKLKSVEGELAQVRTELSRYRTAWANILQREREAKMMVADCEQTRKQSAELERQNRVLQDSITRERDARLSLERLHKTRDLELQNARARLEILEGRNAEHEKERAAEAESLRAHYAAEAERVRAYYIEETEKLRASIEERLAQARRENDALKKAIGQIRTERAAETQRYAQKIADERRMRERMEGELQRELREHETAGERNQARVEQLEKQLASLRADGRKLLSRIRLKMRANRKKLQAMSRMRAEERARNQAMTDYLVQEKLRLDQAIESLLSVDTYDFEALEREIERIRGGHHSGPRVAGPAQGV